MNEKTGGSITLEIEVTKSLSRKRLVRLDLNWKDMLTLPITGDRLAIDRFEVEVVKGPASDDMLLDHPSAVMNSDGPQYWYCRFDAEWIRVETLVSAFAKDPHYLSSRVLS